MEALYILENKYLCKKQNIARIYFDHENMDKTLKIKRGLDLKIEGAVTDAAIRATRTTLVAIVPDDFPGFMPKLEIKEGDTVYAGQPVARHKEYPDIKLCSPIAGIIKAVVRGERRKIERIVIEHNGNDNDTTPNALPPIEKVGDSPDSIAAAIMHSGLWASIRQRPYDIVPIPGRIPRDIFVTALDSAPLAPDLAAQPAVSQVNINAGIRALSVLTQGKVFVGTRGDFPYTIGEPAVHVVVSGPHPAGNPGILAANIAPVNKGETIWTLDIVTLCRIGELMLTGKRSFNTVVALTGPEVKSPSLVSTVDGAAVQQLLDDDIKHTDRHLRIIAGNVLTGTKISTDGFLRFPYRQITVIDEGDDVDEFMGWASMSPSKMSVSHSFPFSALRKRFAPDARLLGGRRALIMSGEMDKVLPMDILPEFLLKAIMSFDIDKMEALGIYEIAPEDFALCEFVDPSKTEIQKTIRQGLDRLRKEIE